MKKFEIVKQNQLFNEIINNNRYIKSKVYKIYYKDNDLAFPRFGIAVGKKIGNAVNRNKIKRQVKVIVDNNKKMFKNGRDYIIMVREAIKDISFKEMELELQKMMKDEENNEKN